MNKHSFLKVLLLSITFLPLGLANVNAQSINDQFKTVVDSSNNYQQYKVIKQTQIKKLWQNTVDSLNKKDVRYSKIKNELGTQKAAIQKQESQLANKEKSLQETIDSANEISLLGIFDIEKGSYKILMWTLILVLAALAFFFYFTGFSAKKEAKYRIKLFEEIQEEYKNYKIKANDNEKKLARALQDERNKLDAYNSR